MAEGGMGTNPQVFVVDSQATDVSKPSETKSRWPRVSQKCLLLLVGLAMLGLVVEGFLIYNLYRKTEQAFSFCGPHSPCRNPNHLDNQQGVLLSRVGHKESNEIPMLPHQAQIEQRPFAHLIGASVPVGDDNVVQWVSEGGEAITRNMSYSNGRLIVEKEGYYYLYSKIQLHAADCVVNQHKVMKDTNAYGQPIELMKSKSFHCKSKEISPKSKETSSKPSSAEDMWNGFLAGIFHLQRGDKIFISLDNRHYFRSGNPYNFMGAFMISL